MDVQGLEKLLACTGWTQTMTIGSHFRVWREPLTGHTIRLGSVSVFGGTVRELKRLGYALDVDAGTLVTPAKLRATLHESNTRPDWWPDSGGVEGSQAPPDGGAADSQLDVSETEPN